MLLCDLTILKKHYCTHFGGEFQFKVKENILLTGQ